MFDIKLIKSIYLLKLYLHKIFLSSITLGIKTKEVLLIARLKKLYRGFILIVSNLAEKKFYPGYISFVWQETITESFKELLGSN